jgi:hypothetical protein
MSSIASDARWLPEVCLVDVDERDGEVEGPAGCHATWRSHDRAMSVKKAR